MPERSFVAGRSARRQCALDVLRRDQREPTFNSLRILRGNTDIRHLNASGVIDALSHVQTDLGQSEGNREGGTDGVPQHSPGVGVEAGRQVNRGDRPGTVIDGLNRGEVGPGHWGRESCSEERVHHNLAGLEQVAHALARGAHVESGVSRGLNKPSIHRSGVAG